jgi:hypothetical protein
MSRTQKPKRIWKTLGHVASFSEDGKEYDVRIDQDGNYGCTCMWWAFHRKERCRHINAYHTGALAQHMSNSPIVPEVMIVGPGTPTGETFRVRRAITFGAIK